MEKWRNQTLTAGLVVKKVLPWMKNEILLLYPLCLINQLFNLFLSSCQIYQNLTFLHIRGAFNKFPDFFVQTFKIVVDTWKFSVLLLYILWDDWPTFMISGSNQQLQQELKSDCHSHTHTHTYIYICIRHIFVLVCLYFDCSRNLRSSSREKFYPKKKFFFRREFLRERRK